jgi:alpha-beta hydrolase superfamily lysophospholipase
MGLNYEEGTQLFCKEESINYQLNRWYYSIGKDSFEDLKEIGSKITNYSEYIEEFLILAESKEKEGDIKKAAYYYRAAEFYILANDPRKEYVRKKFLKLLKEALKIDESQRVEVPYMNSFLPAYKFIVDNSKATIVIFGGFDSYIEELTVLFRYFNKAEYNVIAFEGPGQGSALEDYKIKMDYAWEKPVKCILDYFNLDNVILIGLSLGGILVLRASAYDKRVKYVVAFDVMYDFLECNLRSLPSRAKKTIDFLLDCKAKSITNFIMKKTMKTNFIASWGINQGMHVLGAETPYDYLVKAKKFNTEKISPLVKQDVLIMAGTKDHYVPLEMINKQIKVLSNAKSITARVFSEAEHAQDHCQTSNRKFALDVIINWIDFMIKKDNVFVNS